MLTKRENEVMGAVYSLCKDEGRCLVSAPDLLKLLPSREKFTQESLEKTLRALELDGYFDLLSSERKGEKMYVLTLQASGFAYRRAAVQEKRNAFYKMFLAAVSAVVAFLVGLLLKRIF